MSVSAWMRLMFVLMAAITLSACELVGDIFQAGVAVGVFLVIGAVALIWYLVANVRRRV
jgi:hypothetical protein